MLSGVEIIPATGTGEIDTAVAGLVVTHRASHESGTKHPLVGDIIDLFIVIEIHGQSTHHRIVAEVNPSCHRIEIRHQVIAQFVIPHDGLVGGVILRSDVPHLAERPLSVCPVERDETAELIPAGLEFAPLGEVSGFHARLVKHLLCLDIAVFHGETALVHAPEGQSAHGVVEACGHL